MQADSQPSSMRMDEHQISLRCRTPLMPKSLTLHEVSQVSLTFTPLDPAMMLNWVAHQRAARTAASSEETPF